MFHPQTVLSVNQDIPLVGEHLAKQLLQQFRHRGAVIGVARSQHDVEQLSPVIDHQMQFEAKEPIDRSFATSRSLRHLMLQNAAVMFSIFSLPGLPLVSFLIPN